jgi:endonuclease-3
VELGPLLARLEGRYGTPAAPPRRDPWEQVVAIECAYLVDDARRAATLAALREAVGLLPLRLLAAPRRRIEEAIRGGGMKPEMRAGKLLEAARAAHDAGLGDAGAMMELAGRDPAGASRILRRMPGVSTTVAERILVGAGVGDGLPLESNGLRVLLRLGFGEEKKSWERTLQSAVAGVADPPQTPGASWRALELLRRHGQETCTRTKPACGACVLRGGCPSNTTRGDPHAARP